MYSSSSITFYRPCFSLFYLSVIFVFCNIKTMSWSFCVPSISLNYISYCFLSSLPFLSFSTLSFSLFCSATLYFCLTCLSLHCLSVSLVCYFLSVFLEFCFFLPLNSLFISLSSLLFATLSFCLSCLFPLCLSVFLVFFTQSFCLFFFATLTLCLPSLLPLFLSVLLAYIVTLCFTLPCLLLILIFVNKCKI